MSEEWRPCPFCGYAIFADHEEETSADAEAICCVFDGEDESHYFECPRCETQGPKADCTEDAFEGWNRRPAPKADGLVGQIASAIPYVHITDENVRQAVARDIADALAALKDRDVVLEEAAKLAEAEMITVFGHKTQNCSLNVACAAIAQAIRNLKERV